MRWEIIKVNDNYMQLQCIHLELCFIRVSIALTDFVCFVYSIKIEMFQNLILFYIVWMYTH